MRYKFETNIILTLIGIVLIPIVLFSFVFSNVYRDYIGNVQTELLESVRNEKIQQIKGRFSDMELLFEHYSNTVILEAIESGVNDFTADEMKAQVNGLHDVYIFDGNKEKLYSISEHEQESFDVKRILQTTNFTAPIKIVDYNRQNSGLVMMVMEKLVHNGVTEGYVCYLIN